MIFFFYFWAQEKNWKNSTKICIPIILPWNLMNQIMMKTKIQQSFLDMKIKIEENKIITDLYRKPTDTPTALLPSSAHPGHITPNIVYSMSFRLLRICSIEDIFEIRLQEMKNNFLKPRGYSPKMIEEQFKKFEICQETVL